MDETFSVVCSSLVRNMNTSFEEFQEEIELEITKWPKDTLLGIFPEYCWRLTPSIDVFKYIDSLKKKIPTELTLVLGTLEYDNNGLYTSNAIVLSDSILYHVPKTKILKTEKMRGLHMGKNIGVINLPKFKLGVAVCADLWEPRVMKQLALDEKADIIAVPAWTGTKKGNRTYAKLDWHSLAKTQSNTYGVVIAVADHLSNFENEDVGNATVIFSPANRNKLFPFNDNIIRDIENINLDEVHQARERWKDKGLYPMLI